MGKKRISRRHVLQGLSGAVGAAAIGCGSDGTDNSTTSGATGGADAIASSSVASSSSTGAGGQGGQGSGGQGGAGGAGGAPDPCGPTAKLSPTELLKPIDTIVVLCMENRSFDHYLGSLQLHEGRAIDGLTGKEWNPDPNGVKVPVFKLDNFTVSNPPHNWDPVHQQWDFGKNDGFVQVHAGVHQQEVMGYHVRDQLPQTYALADSFTICERYFASVLGPTWPNRFYLHGATSQSTKGNTPNTSFPNIFDWVKNAGFDATNYYGDIPWCTGAYLKVSDLSGISNFFDDALAGNLPPFTLIDPSFFGAGANDDHPNHNVKLGQAFISSVFSALAASPQYDRMLIVITYDEHGGFFDHVAPPKTFDDDPEFAQLGFRVPTMVLGPYVRRGCSVTTVFDHVSILRTAAVKWKLPDFNQRMAEANDLTSCINPDYLKNPQKPPVLPPVPVSMKALRAQSKREMKIAQPELWKLAESGRIPRHLDQRHRSLEIAEKWLRRGAELGAIKLID